jgi:hypothetical protein
MPLEDSADPLVGPGGDLGDVVCGGRIESVEAHGPGPRSWPPIPVTA